MPSTYAMAHFRVGTLDGTLWPPRAKEGRECVGLIRPHMTMPTTTPLDVAITLDLHAGDVPGDITYSAQWLAARGVRATFFIPSSLLDVPKYGPSLRELPQLGHEVASHTHQHDVSESDALAAGRQASLGFLKISWERHSDFFGIPPRAFRSPGWCALAPGSLDALQALDYHVDSSATPQRLGLLSSRPYEGA